MLVKTIAGLLALTLSTPLWMQQEAPAPAKTGGYSVDAGHSAVVFRVKHLNVSHFYGRFNEVSGSFFFDSENPDKSNVSITIPVTSIDTNDESRDKHLLSPDFFNDKEFPQMTFASNSVSKLANGKFQIKGVLTLHGVEKELTLEAIQVGSGQVVERFGYRVGFETGFTIKRSDFGMEYGLPDVLADEVAITIALEGTPK